MTWLNIEHQPVLIAELKAGLDAALHEIEEDIEPNGYSSISGWSEDNIKTNKLAHHAIDQWDVPILHTWYRYGQFVPAEEIRPTQIEPKPLDEADLPDGREMRKRDYPSPEDYKGFFLEHGLQEILHQPWLEFLKENYEQYAPPSYKQLYLANLGILQLLEEFENDRNPVERADYYYDEFKDYSVDLRAGIESNSQFDEGTRSHVRESLHTIQDALLSLTSRGESIEDTSAINKTREVYHKYVWRWPAFVISQDQARGIDRENFSDEGKNRLNQIKGSCRDELNSMNADLLRSDLKPSSDDYRRIHGDSHNALLSIDDTLAGSIVDV